MESEETLCWTCQNYSKCSWSKGIPVEGWKAKRVVRRYLYEKDVSYLVYKCPQYLEDEEKEISLKELSKLIGIEYHIASRRLIRTPNVLKLIASTKGYELYIYDELDDGNKKCYIKKIDNKGEKKCN